MPNECFQHCKIDVESRMRRNMLFASKYPVSEYTDNLGRIGKVIMDLNINYHDKCRNGSCYHQFTVDLDKHPNSHGKCKYIKNSCGCYCGKLEAKQRS